MRISLKILSILVLVVLLFCFLQKRIFASINFAISNPIITDNDEIEVDATISGLISSSCSITGCYLQGELQSAGGYFGYTYNNSGEYIDYFKTPSSVDEIKTKLFNFIPVSGAWSGKLKAKNNSNSINYYGPGDYLLIFRRFSGNSVSPTSGDSNSIAVSLKLPMVTPTAEPTPTPTPNITSTPFTLRTPDPTPTITPSPTPKATQILLPQKESLLSNTTTASSSSTAAVLSASVEEPSSNSDEPDRLNNHKLPILPVILIISGMCFIGISIFSIIRNGKKDPEVS